MYTLINVGVRTTITTFKDVDVYDVKYCACDKLRRQILSKDVSTKAGDFENFKKAKEKFMFNKKVGVSESFNGLSHELVLILPYDVLSLISRDRQPRWEMVVHKDVDFLDYQRKSISDLTSSIEASFKDSDEKQKGAGNGVLGLRSSSPSSKKDVVVRVKVEKKE
ncbi:unnamed protein product [Arabidopsis thaliana]|uniref:(thale cress) hypothetical protein n=1 Tax=Arabidopsis thaliana TaxID=3702 RepID=A0A7G2EVD5_ARATH|nr:unnamed protein product [Arabidopsis thaliana]